MYPTTFNSSETSLERDLADTVNWNSLPVPVQSKFMETTRERRIAALASALFSLLAGTCSVGAAIGFTASPMVVIGVTVGLGVVALAALITAIVLIRLKPSFNDPVYRLQLRQEAGNALRAFDPATGYAWKYEEIRSRYRQEILSDADISALLSKDVNALSFPAFISKHGLLAIDMLDRHFQGVLREKCLRYCQTTPHLSGREIEKSEAVNKMGITKPEWAAFVYPNEAVDAMKTSQSYAQFIERNGEEAMAYLQRSYPQFGVDVWRSRALSETLTMQISAIARSMPILFAHEILRAEDTLPGGQKIRDRLRLEIAQYQNISDLSHLPKILLEKEILDKSHPHLQRLVLEFVAANPKNYIQNTWLDGSKSAMQLIEQYQLMPATIAQAISEAQQAFQNQVKSRDEILSQIEAEYHACFQQAKAVQDGQKAAAANIPGREHWQNETARLQQIIGQLEGQISTAAEEQKRASAEQTRLQQEIAQNQSEYAKLSARKQSLEDRRPQRSMKKYQQELSAKSKQIEASRAAIAKNPKMSALAVQVMDTQQRKAALEQSASAFAKELASQKEYMGMIARRKSLASEITDPAFSFQKAELEQKIKEAEERRQTSTGIANALKSLKKDPQLEADRTALMALNNKESEFERIDAEIESRQAGMSSARPIQSIEADLAQVQTALHQASAEITTANQELNKLQVTLGKKLGLQRIEQEKRELEEQIAQTEETLKALQSIIPQMESLHRSKNCLVEQLERVQHAYSSRNEDLVRLHTEKNQAEWQLAPLKAKDDQLSGWLQRRNEEIDDQFNSSMMPIKKMRDQKIETLQKVGRANLIIIEKQLLQKISI